MNNPQLKPGDAIFYGFVAILFIYLVYLWNKKVGYSLALLVVVGSIIAMVRGQR